MTSISTRSYSFTARPQKRLCPAADDVVGEPVFLEIGADQHAVDGIVLDHEDMSGEPACRPPASVTGDGIGALGRDGEPEQAPLARRALAADLAAHQLDEPPRDGEAKSGAAILAAVAVGLNVGLEQPLLLKLAEADAGIGDVEAELELAVGVAGIGVQAHRAARGELHRVVGQIGEHLAKADGVALDEARAAHADIDSAEQALLAARAPATRCRRS